MTKQEFLALCESRYPEVEKLNEIKDFYEYEKLFEKNISELSVDRRKKKHSAVSGK